MPVELPVRQTTLRNEAALEISVLVIYYGEQLGVVCLDRMLLKSLNFRGTYAKFIYGVS